MNAQAHLMIVGAAGFVGTHLIAQLEKHGVPVIATILPGETFAAPHIPFRHVDIRDEEALHSLLSETKPSAVIHLAALSSVALSWENPGLAVDINIKGSLHLLEAVRKCCPGARVLLVGSSEEYGVVPADGCLSEETPVQPANPYAVSKATQTMLGRLYHRAYGLDVLIMRAFNHIGAGQAPGFVVPDFCRQIVRIENGASAPALTVGNLEARRDFSDVRDIVRGYLLALKKGRSGEVYNIGSGRSIAIQTILDRLLAMSGATIEVRRDPEKMRPSDTPAVQADITKICRDTGYQPQIALEDSLRDALEYERKLWKRGVRR